MKLAASVHVQSQSSRGAAAAEEGNNVLHNCVMELRGSDVSQE